MSTRQVVLWIINFALMVLVVAVTAAGLWQLATKSRPASAALADQADLRQAVTEAAATGTTKILTYSPDTIEQDLATGASFTTGQFAEYYKNFTTETVVPAAREKGVKTTAVVVQSGVISIESVDHAAVLVFVNQTSNSRDKPEPTYSASAVQVGLQKVGGRWLIESFDPQ